LNDILKGKKYLVEDKASYADLAFVPWFGLLKYTAPNLSEWRKEEKFAAVADWYGRLIERESVKKVKQVISESRPGKENMYDI
jgi:glutathione S-transferase